MIAAMLNDFERELLLAIAFMIVVSVCISVLLYFLFSWL
jgi:hypothetical protein